ncbi:MAG: hypothetical protein KJ064_08610 [Anaerolineae bacterium]|nr:hypothetical protein [Anaerolineae bacterium]
MATIQQREMTDEQRLAEGYTYYERKKQLVMVRELRPEEAPMIIEFPFETVTVEAGYIICYDPGDGQKKKRINDYDHWPVRPDIFKQTYRRWDVPRWKPSPAAEHLMRNGCRPHYKFAGVWAKQLLEPTYIQSVESDEPVLAPAGMWIALGSKNEPWYMEDETFRSRYVV